jgi:hypothetical protein
MFDEPVAKRLHIALLRRLAPQLNKGENMQAPSSGLSYALSEAKRAAKPVIETLTPIFPTFGYGEAAVRQSIGSCINEMEATAIELLHVNARNKGWSKSFSEITKIVLYPLSDPAGTLKTEDKCRESSELELGMLVNVTSNINQQLESWSIPFQFEISDDRKDVNEVLTAAAKDCLTNKSEKKMSLFFGHCDDLKDNGVSGSGYQGKCHIAYEANARKSTIAHELAHVFSPHIFDALPLASLHPDLLEAMCEPVAHGDELITCLSYWNHCRDAGYPDTLTHKINSKGEWGPMDLTMAKLATHKVRDDLHAQIHAEGVDKSYDWIRQNYGARAAEQFVGSFVKTVFIHSMSAIVARNVTSTQNLDLYRSMIHLVGNMLHFGMMNQLTSSLSAMVMCAGLGVMGRTGRALMGVIGDAALLSSFVQLMRRNSDVMLQLVYATCGTTAGAAFSQLIIGFIETCAPAHHERRQVYLDLTKPNSLSAVMLDTYGAVLDIAASKFGVNTEAVKENIYSRMPSLIQGIVEIDRAVANVIEQYVSLQVMTSWIWKSDQQKADAKVQASIEQLSETLDDVKTKFGPSDLPRTPSNTRSFGLNQPLPPLDLNRTMQDDPLLTTDVAAVTGIGSAQAASLQNDEKAKKQQ